MLECSWEATETQLEPNWNLPGTHLAGTQLELTRNRAGSKLEPSWNLAGTKLEHCGIKPGVYPACNQAATKLGPIGTRLETSWNQPGTSMEPSWNQLVTKLEPIKQ